MASGSLLLSLVVFSIPAQESELQREIDAEIAAIKADFQVKVHYHYSAEKFFPKPWREEPNSGEGKALSLEETKRCLAIVRTFLSKHPKAVLKKNLKDVYLLAEMKFQNKPFGGTNSWDGVYIVSQGLEKGYTDEHLEAVAHAEFSSILLRKFDFPVDEWNAVNPTDFKYAKSSVDFLDQVDLYGQSQEMLEQGFLVKYSKTTLEEDFNTMSGWIFTTNDKLKALDDKYPKIKAKHDLCVQFYKSLDAKYDIESPSTIAVRHQERTKK